MRHRVGGTKFNVDVDHRRSLVRNLVASLVQNGTIRTTKAKARVVQSSFDKLVTTAKKDTVASKRSVSSILTNRDVYIKFMTEVLPQLSERTSGYTTAENLDTRPGDRAQMCKVTVLGKSS